MNRRIIIPIAIFSASFLLVGCGAGGSDSGGDINVTGNGNSVCVVKGKTGKEKFLLGKTPIACNEIGGDVKSFESKGESQITNNETAEPVFAIPVTGGIDNVAISNTDVDPCIQAGGTIVNDSRGRVCSDGQGGVINLGSEQ